MAQMPGAVAAAVVTGHHGLFHEEREHIREILIAPGAFDAFGHEGPADPVQPCKAASGQFFFPTARHGEPHGSGGFCDNNTGMGFPGRECCDGREIARCDFAVWIKDMQQQGGFAEIAKADPVRSHGCPLRAVTVAGGTYFKEEPASLRGSPVQ